MPYYHRASNITDVVVACSKDTGYEWFEQLLETVSSVYSLTHQVSYLCLIVFGLDVPPNCSAHSAYLSLVHPKQNRVDSVL